MLSVACGLCFSNNASIVGGGMQSYNSQGNGSSFSSPPLLTHEQKPAVRGGFASLRDEPVTQRARVLYDYEASSAGEISLTAEQVI